MNPDSNDFKKYSAKGPYHWNETHVSFANRNLNVPLLGRYSALLSLRSGKRKRSLEIGCGDGCFLAKIGREKVISVGLDLEMSGLQWARRKLSREDQIFLIQGNSTSLPFQSDSFDEVFLPDVIEHVENPDRVLQEISRVMKKGGDLFLSTPQKNRYRQWDVYHEKEFSPHELKNLLETYFCRVRIMGCWAWPLLWFWENSRVGKYVFRGLAVLGENVFARGSENRLFRFGQLLVSCNKG